MINIVDFIPKGKINAIPSVELSRRTGLVSRDIEKAVFEARKSGVAVCSSAKGYFVPSNAAEALQYYAAQQSRIRSGNIALRPVREYIKREGERKQWEQLEFIEKELEEND